LKKLSNRRSKRTKKIGGAIVSMVIEKYTIVIIETKPDYFIVKCGSCKGNGCSLCNYYGYRKLKVPKDWNCDVGVGMCGSCKGNGCSSCDYIGAFVGCFPRLVCGSCKGDGCSSCNYHGSVWVGNIR
jgi:hypothetical protein